MTTIALIVVALDQITKLAVLAAMRSSEPTRRIDIAGSWLALEYTENRGVAFGLLATAGPWLAIVPIAVLAGLLFHHFAASAPSRWETVAIGAIVGGAIGNMVDRLRLGYVVDYISVSAWPNFNVADSAITLGVLLLLCSWLIPRGDEHGGSDLSKEANVHGFGPRPDQQRVRQ